MVVVVLVITIIIQTDGHNGHSKPAFTGDPALFIRTLASSPLSLLLLFVLGFFYVTFIPRVNSQRLYLLLA